MIIAIVILARTTKLFNKLKSASVAQAFSHRMILIVYVACGHLVMALDLALVTTHTSSDIYLR